MCFSMKCSSNLKEIPYFLILIDSVLSISGWLIHVALLYNVLTWKNLSSGAAFDVEGGVYTQLYLVNSFSAEGTEVQECHTVKLSLSR